MKKIKEKIMIWTGVLFLTLAYIVAFNPTALVAQSGTQKFFSTVCTGGPGSPFNCNNCRSGNQPCFDHTCAECRPTPPMM